MARKRGVEDSKHTMKHNLDASIKEILFKIDALKHNLVEAENRENELISKLNRYKQLYEEERLTYAEYEFVINKYLKGKSATEWLFYFTNYRVEAEQTIEGLELELLRLKSSPAPKIPESLEEKASTFTFPKFNYKIVSFVFIATVLMFIGFLISEPSLTGYTVYNVEFELNESWDIENGIVRVSLNDFVDDRPLKNFVSGKKIKIDLREFNLNESGDLYIDILINGSLVDSTKILFAPDSGTRFERVCHEEVTCINVTANNCTNYTEPACDEVCERNCGSCQNITLPTCVNETVSNCNETCFDEIITTCSNQTQSVCNETCEDVCVTEEVCQENCTLVGNETICENTCSNVTTCNPVCNETCEDEVVEVCINETQTSCSQTCINETFMNCTNQTEQVCDDCNETCYQVNCTESLFTDCVESIQQQCTTELVCEFREIPLANISLPANESFTELDLKKDLIFKKYKDKIKLKKVKKRKKGEQDLEDIEFEFDSDSGTIFITLNGLVANTSIEQIGVKDLGIVQVPERKEPLTLSTDVFAMSDTRIENATLRLPARANVNHIVRCADWNFTDDSCSGGWELTNLSFKQEAGFITFTVDSFSGYAGASIEVLNEVTYLKEGETWTVFYNTTGTADLTISGVNNTNWTEMLEDVLATDNDEMEFMDISCGNESLVDELYLVMEDGNQTLYSTLNESDNLEIQALLLPSYNCSSTGSVKNKILIPGYATLKFEFGDDVAYAYDPPVCDYELSACKTSGWVADSVYCLTDNIEPTDNCMGIDNSGITFDCQKFNITGDDGSGDSGIFLNGSADNVIINNCSIWDFGKGINATGESGNYVENLTITYSKVESSSNYGIYFSYVTESLINNSKIDDSYFSGIRLVSSTNSIISSSDLDSSTFSPLIALSSANYNIMKNNNLTNSGQHGFSIYGDNNNITGNNISYNGNAASEYGIYMGASADNNLIYNNYLNNTYNADDDNTEDANANRWNYTLTLGTNILGGPYIGGNYWSNSTACTDSNGDGICDNSYVVGESTEQDYLPLSKDNLLTDCKSSGWSADTYYIVVNDISTTGDCMDNIDQSGITIDCLGYTLDGDGGSLDRGFDIVSSADNVIIKNCRISTFARNFYATDVNNLTIDNSQFLSSSYQNIQFSGVNNSIINNSRIYDSSTVGTVSALSIAGGYNNTISFCDIDSSTADLIILQTDNSIIEYNNITNSGGDGINFSANDLAVNNIIRHNNISNNGDAADEYGLKLAADKFPASGNNLIYDNILFNTYNALDEHAADADANRWNTTKTLGTNILGGPYIGGNFWSDNSGCSDAEEDGICDSSYSVPTVPNYDYLPLANITGYLHDCKSSGWEANKEYWVMEDITTTSNCFRIDADNVTLNCMDYTLNSNGSGTGIYTAQENIIIRNCTIDSFSTNIELASSSNNSRIEITNSTNATLYGINLSGTNITFANNTLKQFTNDTYSIYLAGDNILIKENTINHLDEKEGYAIKFDSANDVRIIGNEIYGTSNGLITGDLRNVTIDKNNMSNNNYWSYIINFQTGSTNVSIINNNCTTFSNTYERFIFFNGDSDNINLSYNKIEMFGSFAFGITSSTQDYTDIKIKYNDITTDQSTSDGVTLSNLNDSIISNNIINSATEGIGIYYGGYRNIISYNNISAGTECVEFNPALGRKIMYNNVTKNICIAGYFNTDSDDQANVTENNFWLNHFQEAEQGIRMNLTDNNFCIQEVDHTGILQGHGNFYHETTSSSYIPPTDCGIAYIQDIEVNEGFTTNMTLNWSRQSSYLPLSYTVEYSEDSGSTWSRLLTDYGFNNTFGNDATSQSVSLSRANGKTYAYIPVPKVANVTRLKFRAGYGSGTCETPVVIDIANDSNAEYSFSSFGINAEETIINVSGVNEWINNNCISSPDQNCSLPIKITTGGLFEIGTCQVDLDQLELMYTNYWWDISSLTDANTYKVRIKPNDGTVNATANLTNVFTIDNTGPNITFINQTVNLTNDGIKLVNDSHDGSISEGSVLNFRFNVSDVFNDVSGVWVTIWQGLKSAGTKIGTWFMSLIDGLWQVSVDINATFPNGTVHYTIYANDSLNNIAEYDGNFSKRSNNGFVCSDPDECEYQDLALAFREENATNQTIVIKEAGVWALDETITMYKDSFTNSLSAIILDVDGAIIDCNGSSILGNSSGIGIYSAKDNVIIRNCSVEMFSTNFKLDSTSDNSIIEYCNSTNATTYGFSITGLNSTISNNNILGNNPGAGYALYLTGSNHSIRENIINVSRGGTAYGIYASGNRDARFDYNDIISTATYAMRIRFTTNVTINGNNITTNKDNGKGIEFEDPENGVVEGNIISGYASTSYLLQLTSGQNDTIITKNKFEFDGDTIYGIYFPISPSNYYKNISITYNNMSGSATAGAGIYSINLYESSISHNQIHLLGSCVPLTFSYTLNNTIIAYNNISTAHYAMYLRPYQMFAVNNNITGNIFDTSYVDGVYFFNNATDNNIWLNHLRGSYGFNGNVTANNYCVAEVDHTGILEQHGNLYNEDIPSDDYGAGDCGPTYMVNPIGGETPQGRNITINWSKQSGYYPVSYTVEYTDDSGSSWNRILTDYGYDNKFSDGTTSKQQNIPDESTYYFYLNVPKVVNISKLSFDLYAGANPGSMILDIANDSNIEGVYGSEISQVTFTVSNVSGVNAWLRDTCTNAANENCTLPIRINVTNEIDLTINNIDLRYTNFWWNNSGLADGSYKIKIIPNDFVVNATNNLTDTFTIERGPYINASTFTLYPPNPIPQNNITVTVNITDLQGDPITAKCYYKDPDDVNWNACDGEGASAGGDAYWGSIATEYNALESIDYGNWTIMFNATDGTDTREENYTFYMYDSQVSAIEDNYLDNDCNTDWYNVTAGTTGKWICNASTNYSSRELGGYEAEMNTYLYLYDSVVSYCNGESCPTDKSGGYVRLRRQTAGSTAHARTSGTQLYVYFYIYIGYDSDNDGKTWNLSWYKPVEDVVYYTTWDASNCSTANCYGINIYNSNGDVECGQDGNFSWCSGTLDGPSNYDRIDILMKADETDVDDLFEQNITFSMNISGVANPEIFVSDNNITDLGMNPNNFTLAMAPIVYDNTHGEPYGYTENTTGSPPGTVTALSRGFIKTRSDEPWAHFRYTPLNRLRPDEPRTSDSWRYYYQIDGDAYTYNDIYLCSDGNESGGIKIGNNNHACPGACYDENYKSAISNQSVYHSYSSFGLGDAGEDYCDNGAWKDCYNNSQCNSGYACINNGCSKISATLESPLDNWITNSSTVRFECNASSDNSLLNMSLYHNNSGTWSLTSTNTISGTEARTVFNVTGLSENRFDWTCYVCDNNHQCKFANANYTLTIDDTLPTLIEFVNPTPDNASEQLVIDNSVYVNVSTLDTNNRSAFIDWNYSLKGYWHFEDNDGATMDDASSWDNDGYCDSSTCPSWTTGARGKALKFDGETDYVNVDPSDSINITGDEITIEAWFRADTQNFTQERYVVSSDQANSDVLVISYVDNNEITYDTNSVILDSGEIATLDAADISAGTVVNGTGPFEAIIDSSYHDMLIPESFAGYEFGYYYGRYENDVHVCAPFENANISFYNSSSQGVKIGSINLTQGDCGFYTVNTSNTMYYMNSTGKVLAQSHAKTSVDAIAMYPLSDDAWIIDTSAYYLVAEDNTEINYYGSDGSTDTTIANYATATGLPGSGSQGDVTYYHITADKSKISAYQLGDGDGTAASGFFPQSELSNVFAIPESAQYFAIATTEPSTTCSLKYANGTTSNFIFSNGSIVNQTTSGSLAYPYPNKIYIGNSSTTETDFIPSNTFLICDALVYLMYEDGTNSDETNIYGLKDAGIMFKPGSYGLGYSPSGKVNGYINGKGLSADASENDWHHVALVYNGTTIMIYVDGNLSDSDTLTGDILGSKSNLTIGKYGNIHFNGRIDEVKVWDRALSTQEIDSSYQNHLTRLEANFTNLSAATYSYKAYVVDMAGNWNTTLWQTVTINPNAYPEADLFYPWDSWFVNSTVRFECNLTDSEGLANVSLYHNNTGTWHLNASQAITGTSDYAYFNVTGLDSNSFVWGCYVCDDVGACNFSTNHTLTVENVNPDIEFVDPTYLNNSQVSSSQDSTFVNVSITDASNNYSAIIDWNRSLRGWYRFEENYDDTSSWDNQGDCTGTNCPELTTGMRGKAYMFDGDDDYVTVPHDDNLNYVMGSTTMFTISAWIYPTDWINYGAINKAPGGSWSLTTNGLWAYAGGFICAMGDANTSHPNDPGSYVLTSSYQPALNNWYHVVCIGDGENLKMYVNGEEQGSTAISGITYDRLNTTADLTIGKRYAADSGGAIQGIVDEVQLFSRNLSLQEINASYNAYLYNLNRNFTNLEPGTYTYKAYVVDQAGNLNSTEERTFIVNSIPTQDTPILNSTIGNNLTNENITCYPNNFADENNDAVYPTFSWWKDDEPYQLVNIPANINDTSIAKDLSGNANDFTPTGSGVKWVESGKVGGSYNFTDTSSDNRLVGPELQVPEEYTLSAWIKSDKNNNQTAENVYLGPWVGCISLRVMTAAQAQIPGILIYNKSLSGVGGSCGSANAVSVTGTDDVTDGAWHQIVATVSNVTKDIIVYVDGDEKNTGTVNDNLFFGSQTTLINGWTENYGHLVGQIDEFKIYNDDLSAEQVASLYLEELNNVNTSTIVSDDTSKGDSWKCSVTPSDGYDYGLTKNSTELSVVYTNITINLTSPEDNWYVNSTAKFECSASSTINILNVSLYHNNTGTWHSNTSISTSSNSVIAHFTVTGLATNNFDWSCRACDASDCYFASVNRTLHVDITNPDIEFVNPTADNNTKVTTFNNFNYVNVSVSDASNNYSAFIDWNNSLRGWWRLEEANGETFADSSSWSNDGNCSNDNSCPEITTGMRGKAYNFNGTQGAGGAGPCIVASDMDFDDEVTVEFWYKPNNLVGVSGIIEKSSGGCTGPIELYRSNDQINWRVRNESGECDALGTGNILSTDSWQHIAATYNGSIKKIFVNGEEKNSAELTGAIENNDYSLAIGAVIGADGVCFGYFDNAKIDEVKIWTRALSSQEINASYNSELYEPYRNFTNLDSGTYTYKAYVVDQAGNLNNTEQRTFIVNTAPTVTSAILNSTYGTNLTTENLTVYATSNDNDSDAVGFVYDFRKDGISDAVLNMPFDVNGSNGNTTNVKDYTSYSNNGTLNNNLIWNKTGGYDGSGAYEFDALDDYISIPDNPTFRTSTQTYSCWFKTNSTPPDSFGGLISHSNSADGYHILQSSTGKIRAYRRIQPGAWSYAEYSTALLENNWHHVVAVYDNKNVSIYVDGILRDSAYNLNATIFLNSSLHIGLYASPLTWLFNGSIDQVQIWNRTLSADEIAMLYNNGLGMYNRTHSDATQKGDTWYAVVTPVDNYEEGDAYSSNNVTIETSVATVTLTSPEDGWYVNSTVKFECEALSDIPITSVSLYHNNTGTWHSNSTITSSATSVIAHFTVTGLATNNFDWNCRACDATDCYFASINRTLHVDVTNPDIEFVNPTAANNTKVATFNNLNYVNVSVTDASNNYSTFIDWNRSLVGWYRFEENYEDSSTWSNDGSCTGTECPNLTTGMRGKAYKFDGIDDKITTTSDVGGADSKTFSVWMKASNLSSWRRIALESTAFNSLQYVGLVLDSSNTQRINLYQSNGTGSSPDNPYYIKSSALVTNTWYHVVGVIDKSNNILKIYINGELNSSKVFEGLSSASYYNPTGDVVIGGGSGAFDFEGIMDEVMVFDRALSPEEINASYNAGIYKLYYNFTGLDSGTYTYKAYVVDQAGNLNNTEQRTFIVNTAPTITSAILNSTYGTNLTTENLTVYVTSNDADSDSVSLVYDFRKDSISDAMLNMPFNVNGSNEDYTNVKDYTTHGNNATHNGTLTTMPKWNSSCNAYSGSGGCYEFDGIDDYLLVDDAPSNSMRNEVTVSVWIQENNLTANVAYVWKHSYNYLLYGPGSSISFLAYNATPTSSGASFSKSSLNSGFNHVVGIFNGTNSMIYLNGEFMSGSGSTILSDGLRDSNGDLFIGRRGDTVGDIFFNGSLDQINIYNRTLSPAEIATLYNNGLGMYNRTHSDATAKGDTWYAVVTPSDIYEEGEPYSSNNVIIETSVATVNLTEPQDGWYVNSTAKFECLALSDIPITSVSLYHNNTGTWYSNATITSSANSVTAHFTVTGLDTNNFVWSCRACDATDCYFASANRTLKVDVTNPDIEFVNPTAENNTKVTTFNNFNYVNVSVSDASNNYSAFIDWNRSLIGWYRFEENYNDSSTWNNDGTCSGSACPNLTTGMRGKAYKFDGVDDYINISYNNLLDLENDFTFNVWIYPKGSSITSEANILTKEYSFEFARYNDDGNIRWAFGNTNPGWAWHVTSGNTPLNQWSLVTITYSSDAVIKTYINGEEKDSYEGSGSLAINTNDLWISGRSAAANRFFNGSIDEVMIFDRALSPEEINASYNANIYKLYHNFTNLDSGTYTYKAYVVDQAGNLNSTEERTFIVNTAPTVTSAILNSTYGTNLTTENLTVYATSNDNDSDTVTLVYDWRNNEISDVVLNMPFEVNGSDGNTSNVKDYSTFGNNGTLYGPIWNSSCDAFASSRGCYEFDGLDDYIAISNDESINFTSEDFTIMFWAKPKESIAANARAISKGTYQVDGYEIFVDNDNAQFRTYQTDEFQTSSSNSHVLIGTWNHFAVARSGASARIYFNGEDDTGSAATHTDPLGTTDPLQIGRYVNSNSYTFNGSIDHVMIWDRKLSAEEIAMLYNNGAAMYNRTHSNATTIGDSWKAVVTPIDNYEEGTAVESNTVSLNTPPGKPILAEPTHGNNTLTNRTVFFRWLPVSDAEGNPITYNLSIKCYSTAGGSCSPSDDREYGGISDTNYTLTDGLNYLWDDNYYYNWTVTAYDSYQYGEESNQSNFSIISEVIISMTNDGINFGSLNIGDGQNTTTRTPLPFEIQNLGNVLTDVNISSATSLFSSAAFPSSYYMYRVNITPGYSDAFNYSASQTSWANMPAVNSSIITSLNYSTGNDKADIDVHVEVPLDEPSGDKDSIITFIGWYA